MLEPVIILGVPRSGTTLLRVLLDSHSKIAACPETPWITGGYVRLSTRDWFRTLTEHRQSPVAKLPGVSREFVLDVVRAAVCRILEMHLEKKGKNILVLKTPDDIENLEFLLELFPKSKYIHICRDGRDVARSTVVTFRRENRSHLRDFGAATFINALRRWTVWERKCRLLLSERKGIASHFLTYENLVRQPEEELARICKFLGKEYEEQMLDFSSQPHDLPGFEYGTKDLQRKPSIDAQSVQRWKLELKPSEMVEVDMLFADALLEFGYRPCAAEIDLTGVRPPTWVGKVFRRCCRILRKITRLGPKCFYRIGKKIVKKAVFKLKRI